MHHDLHDKQYWTVGDVLERQASMFGEKNLLQVDGEALSYRDAYSVGCQVANLLIEHGVERDDFVADLEIQGYAIGFDFSW